MSRVELVGEVIGMGILEAGQKKRVSMSGFETLGVEQGGGMGAWVGFETLDEMVPSQ